MRYLPLRQRFALPPPQGFATGRVKAVQLFEHMVGARHLEFAGGFDIELFDDAVVDDHRETLAALAHAEGSAVHGQAHGFGEGAVAVGEHGDGRAGIGILAPGAHHEGVVDRRAGDLVDALGLEILGLVDEAGKMLGRAGRGESAGDREKGDLAALEIIGGIDLFGSVFGDLYEGRVGQLVSGLDRHGRHPFLEGIMSDATLGGPARESRTVRTGLRK